MSQTEHEIGNPIDHAAAQWAARSFAGLDAAGERALEAWRNADPRHAGSYLRALALEKMAATAHLAEDSPQPPMRADRQTGRSFRATQRKRLAGMAIAASLVAAVGIASLIQLRPARITTERGEIRNVALEDGSTAMLDTQSAIAVSLREDRRTIDLIAGDAWFDVAHDKRRPFVVRHAGLLVRATGTAFEVSALDDGVEVTVSEGVVEVSREGSAQVLATLRAGDRWSLNAGQIARRMLDAAQVERKLSWREGMIVLDGDTLSAAIGNFNRYNAGQIRIASPDLASRRVYGAFRSRDPEGLAGALAIALDARVEREGNDFLIFNK